MRVVCLLWKFNYCHWQSEEIMCNCSRQIMWYSHVDHDCKCLLLKDTMKYNYSKPPLKVSHTHNNHWIWYDFRAANVYDFTMILPFMSQIRSIRIDDTLSSVSTCYYLIVSMFWKGFHRLSPHSMAIMTKTHKGNGLLDDLSGIYLHVNHVQAKRYVLCT